MSHSSDGSSPATVSSLRTVRSDGTPIYRYAERPGRPPVSVSLLDTHLAPASFPPRRRHAHDFLVLVYVERGSGTILLDDREVRLRGGEVRAVLPGQVIATGSHPESVHGRAWSVAFTPDAVPALASVSPLTWTHHPLLALFGSSGGAAVVPVVDQPRWTAWMSDLADELRDLDQVGAREAAAALLTRILVASARLAPDRPTPLDPLTQRVFEQIEAVYTEPISATDIADALGYTPGHLTTALRERTGRTLLDWITERRLTEVRRLLRETDLSLTVIATRTGLRNASYLVRRFKARYGVTPDRWRRDLVG